MPRKPSSYRDARLDAFQFISALAKLPTRHGHLTSRAGTKAELDALRRSVRRGTPFGSEAWTTGLIARLGLEHTIRPQGRPRKAPPGS